LEEERLNLARQRQAETERRNRVAELLGRERFEREGIESPERLTKSEVEGLFLLDNPEILRQLFDQPAAVTPAAPRRGVDEATARAFGREAQEEFLASRRPRSAFDVDPFSPAVLDSSVQVGINAYNRARGGPALGRTGPDTPSAFGNQLARSFLGGEPQQIPEDEGTVDQLLRLFGAEDTQPRRAVSKNIEAWGSKRFGEQWKQATPKQKLKAARKAGIN
jgi:hypothetical protein